MDGTARGRGAERRSGSWTDGSWGDGGWNDGSWTYGSWRNGSWDYGSWNYAFKREGLMWKLAPVCAHAAPKTSSGYVGSHG